MRVGAAAGVLAVTVSALGLLGAGPAITSASAAPSVGPSAGYVPVPSARGLDTRTGVGAPAHAVAAAATLTLQVTGRAGVPQSGVGAVAINITVVSPAAGGYVTAYSTQSTRPLSSNVNFTPGRTAANLVIASVGADGKVLLFNGSPGTVQLVADVSGYYVAGYPGVGGLVPMIPSRLLDTRVGTGAPRQAVAPHTAVSLKVLGGNGAPALGTASVILNVTVTRPTAGGDVTVFPQHSARPLASNLNFTTGETAANLVIAQVGWYGDVELYNDSPGTVELVADIDGYFSSGVGTGGPDAGGFSALTPTRLLDTRTGLGAPKQSVAAGATLDLEVGGRGGVPPFGTAAVVLNVTVTAPVAAGDIRVYPQGSGRPSTSNLNHTSGQTVANLVITPLGSGGGVSFFNDSLRSVQLVVDVAGYVFTDTPPGPVTVGQTTVADPVQEGLVAVSCATASTCVAVDRRGGAFVRTGGSWSAAHRQPSGSGDTAISCPTTVFCAAVGYNTAAMFDGAVWSSATLFDPGTRLLAVSCTSATFCMAVDDHGQARRYTGTSWDPPVAVGGAALLSVSCTSPTFCGAVDYQGHAFTYDGAGWSSPVTVFGTTTQSASIDCPTTTFCAVVETGVEATFNGTGWSAPTTLAAGKPFTELSCAAPGTCVAPLQDGSATWRLSGGTWVSGPAVAAGWFVAFSCGGPSSCVAVGDEGTVQTDGIAAGFNGTAWSAPVVVAAHDEGAMTAISCATTTFCAAVDGSGLATTFDGTSWAPAVLINPDASTIPGAGLTSVSCPTATSCVAVTSRGEAQTYDGTSWAPPTTVDSLADLTSVSCADPSFCVAVADSRAFVLDGVSWSAGTTIDSSGHALVSVSCPTSTFCAAVDDGGRVSEYNGSGWSVPLLVDTVGALRAVSCPSAVDCTASDSTGHTLRLVGTTWSTPQSVGYVTDLPAISCVGTATCRVAATWGVLPVVAGVHGPGASISSDPHPAISCVTSTFCVVVSGDVATVTS